MVLIKEEKRDFRDLIERLLAASVLAHLNHPANFTFQTDANMNNLGEVKFKRTMTHFEKKLDNQEAIFATVFEGFIPVDKF